MDHAPSDRAERLAAFSTWLARERDLRGLSHEAVLRATRLSPAVLEALEGGEAFRLPPRAYVLGYLRAYATAVGLDPDDVVLRYEEAAGTVGEQPGRPSRKLVPMLAASAVALAAAGCALWVWLHR
jgi:cytoskeletal protein RodZ